MILNRRLAGGKREASAQLAPGGRIFKMAMTFLTFWATEPLQRFSRLTRNTYRVWSTSWLPAQSATVRHQGLETGVPPELLRVQLSVRLHHPAQVPWPPQRPNDQCRLCVLCGAPVDRLSPPASVELHADILTRLFQ